LGNIGGVVMLSGFILAWTFVRHQRSNSRKPSDKSKAVLISKQQDKGRITTKVLIEAMLGENGHYVPSSFLSTGKLSFVIFNLISFPEKSKFF